MFFAGLSELMEEGQIVNLNLMKKGDKLIVSIMPKVQDMPESAMKKLIPLNVSGTPVELDQGFLEAVSQPIQERFGLVTNVDAFRENTKTAVTKKTTVTTSNTAKDNKLTKNERMLADAAIHEKAGRWPEAYAIYKKASAAEPDNVKLKEKVMEVWSKMAQRPLFGYDQDEIQIETEEIISDSSTEITDDSSMEYNNENENDNEDEIDDDDDNDDNIESTTAPVVRSVIPEQENTSSPTGEQPPVDMFAQILGIANKIS